MTTTDVANINTNNFAEMAKAMGMGSDMSSPAAKQSTLPRLRIWNSAVMGQVEVKGKLKNMEVVPAGMFRLQMPDDTFVYAEKVELRVFVQRFMHKRYDSDNRMYVKTIMAEDLNHDLKDNIGTFNCGKAAGFASNFKELPKEQQQFIVSIKRTRILMGDVKLINAVDGEGNEIDTEISPFIWEIDNRDAFKTLGVPIATMGRQKRLPVQHWITCGTEEHTIPTGAIYFLPTQEVDLTNNIELTEADQTKFADFMEWIGNYNQYIVNSYNEKAKRDVSKADADLVDEFIQIEEE